MEEILKQILAKLDAVESSIRDVNSRFNQVDKRFDQVEERLSHIDAKLDTHHLKNIESDEILMREIKNSRLRRAVETLSSRSVQHEADINAIQDEIDVIKAQLPKT